MKIAICQMMISRIKEDNVARAVKMIKESADNKADFCLLPEMFNCPYENEMFPIFAEDENDSYTLNAISKVAKETGIYVFAGTIPEKEGDKIYNTAYVFHRNGEIIGKHRKLHLFDINIPGKVTFKESEILSPGDKITLVDTEFGKVGMAICYDLRFHEIFREMSKQGAKVIMIPSAFSKVTGLAHWELLLRTRAIDNQVFIAGSSPARDENSKFKAYGYSMVSGPWGEVLGALKESEDILLVEVDLYEVDEVRSKLPLLSHLRKDLY